MSRGGVAVSRAECPVAGRRGRGRGGRQRRHSVDPWSNQETKKCYIIIKEGAI